MKACSGWEGASILAEPERMQVIAESGMVRGDIAEHGRVRLAGCEGCSGGCDWLAVGAALAGWRLAGSCGGAVARVGLLWKRDLGGEGC